MDRDVASDSLPLPSGKRIASGSLTPVLLLVVWAIGLAVTLALYAPALDGDFISDDWLYLGRGHPAVESLNGASLRAAFDPWGVARHYSMVYDPVFLVFLAVEKALVGGASTLGFHVVNALLHAGNVAIVVAFLGWIGLRRGTALALGGLFLLHPANVDAVAWITQSKTLISFGLAMLALLLLQRRPAAATIIFAAALLTKSQAAIVLPVAFLLTLCGRLDGRRGALVAWGIATAVAAWLSSSGPGFVGLTYYPEFDGQPWLELQTRVAVIMRYVGIATLGTGLAPQHDIVPPPSLFDPWWLVSLVVVTSIGVRTWICARRHDLEAALWAFPAGSYAISMFNFDFAPMADRYVYYMLPGLLGIAGLALERSRRTSTRPFSDWRIWLTATLGIGLAVNFGVRTYRHSAAYQNDTTALSASAVRYPEGRPGLQRELDAAVTDGDPALLATSLESYLRLSPSRMEAQLARPEVKLESQRSDIRQAIERTARRHLDYAERTDDGSVSGLIARARFHRMAGDYERAEDLYEEALLREPTGFLHRYLLDVWMATRKEAAAKRSRLHQKSR